MGYRRAISSWQENAGVRISFEPGVTKQFRTTAWKFQQTFRTPLKDLERFTNLVTDGIEELRGARLAIYTWVFDPKELYALLSAASLATDLPRDRIVHAENRAEATSLLRAGLAGWVDFAFIPDPKTFCIYADHDEDVTFFAATRGNLNRAAAPLRKNGYQVIENYIRKF